MNSKKINLINGAIFLVCLICGVISYYISPRDWSWPNLLLNISVSLFQLCLCILIVNIYLSGKDKEIKNEAIFHLLRRSISKFVTKLDDILLKEFGKTKLEKLRDEFLDCKYDMDKISNNDINQYINAIKPHYHIIIEELGIMSRNLTQLCFSGLLNNDPESMQVCTSIIDYNNELKLYDINNPKEYREIVGHFDLIRKALVSFLGVIAKGAGILKT